MKSTHEIKYIFSVFNFKLSFRNFEGQSANEGQNTNEGNTTNERQSHRL